MIVAALPLASAIEFSGDEGPELMKALLCSRGCGLYTQIWNDQPPLFTSVLSAVFNVCGPTALAARLTAASFGLMLFLVFFSFVKRTCSTLCALAGTLFLATSPAVLQLSVSAMQEVPAFAVAMASAFSLLGSKGKLSVARVVMSGVMMGLALALKFTVLLLWPAVFIHLILMPPTGEMSGFRRGCAAVSWAVLSVAVCGALCWMLGVPSASHLFLPHLQAHEVRGLPGPDDYGFLWRMVWSHMECVLLAILGTATMLRHKQHKNIMFPVAALITVSSAHFVHRPVWEFYYLHIALPLSWLGGCGAAWLAAGAVPATASCGEDPASSKSGYRLARLAGAAALTALLCARMQTTVTTLSALPIASQSRAVADLKAANNGWVFSFPVVYAFHAEALVPPKLAVLSLKRYWSACITTEEIIHSLKHYRPERVYLASSYLNRELSSYLRTDYSLLFADGHKTLHVIRAEPPQTPK